MVKLQPSLVDKRDKIASLPLVESLPPAVDLKPMAREVEQQSQFNSCTANAGCSALELMYKQKGIEVNLSRFFVYYYERQLGNLIGDSGAYPRDIGKTLLKYGVCHEVTWPYVPANLYEEPSESARTEAAIFKILSYESLVGDKLTLIKTALSQGIPVLLNIEVHAGFIAVTGSWKKHSWDWKTTTENPSKGWHEILVIGYDDESQRLLIENSWGIAWGDHGFGGIPYDMVTAPSFGELWILNPNYDIGTAPLPPVPVQPEVIKSSNAIKYIVMTILVAGIGFAIWNLLQ